MKKCLNCGKNISGIKRYCSKKCWWRSSENAERMVKMGQKLGASRKGKTLEEIHGKEKAKIIIEKFCGIHLGKPLSEEHKRKIGEANKKIPHTKEQNKKISETLMGHDVPEATRRKIRESLLGNIPWNKGLTKETDERIKSIPRSKEWNEKIREGNIKTYRERGRTKQWKERQHLTKLGKPCPYSEGWGRGRCGKRKDLNNQFFRSRWEANFARILNYYKIPWEYEYTRFDLGEHTYYPDFKIFDPNAGEYFVEIFGCFDDAHKRKLGLFQKKYPNEKLQIINDEIYQDLKKEFENKIKNWEG